MKHSFFILFLIISLVSFAQKKSADTLYLMNGRIVVAPVLDTNIFSATIIDPEDSTKRMSIESETLFAIKFNNGGLYYYYQEDTVRNWFTRDEMWLFMQGERDAKKGFKPWGAFYGSMAAGLAGGASGLVLGTAGTFFGPVVPIAFFTTVGIPKVRIKHNTVTTPTNLDYDVYILGYEREARAKRRRYSLVGGGIGVALGYIAYFSLRNIVLK
ncbi:MAG: hypothetical protein ACYDCN_04405 [Bacteroidia bacterium]